MKRIYTKRMMEMNKLYREKNLEQIKLKQKIYGLENREKIRERCRVWYLKHRKKVIAKQKQYYLKNKVERVAYVTKYQKKRLKEDPNYRLARILRLRLYHALMGNTKMGSSVRDLGCTVGELRVHLEKQFKKGMTWDKIHIDHIKPLSKFDLTDRKQFLKACHYTNLQPMWPFDNLSKGAK